MQDEGNNDLYCKTCNQYFSSLHNKKEHLFGRQHLQNLTGKDLYISGYMIYPVSINITNLSNRDQWQSVGCSNKVTFIGVLQK